MSGAGREPSLLRLGASAIALSYSGAALAQDGASSPAVTVASPPSADATSNTPATAVTAGTSATETFTPADFARFAPRSALDMVRQIPDFRISAVSDARGLGQASQNILINGQRIAGKDQDAEAVLARIAASAIARIEVVDGATLSIPGLTGRVANVVTIPSGLTGQFRWVPEFRPVLGANLPSGRVSLSGRLGASDVSFSLSNDGALRGGAGLQTLTRADGALLYERDELARYDFQAPKLAASIGRAWGDGSALNLALSAQYSRDRIRIDGAADLPRFEPPFDDSYLGNYDGWSSEASGDYAFPISAGATIKLIGLQRLGAGETRDRYSYRYRGPGEEDAGTALSVDERYGESVLRGELTTARGWTLAIEGAYNFLDLDSRIGTVIGDRPVAFSSLSGGTVYVDEWRAEASASRRFTFSPSLTLQATLAGEFSRLRLAGQSRRDFVRPKGALALAWTASPRWTVNAAIERRVGQLSFGDFSASVNLQQGAQLGSNADLVPAQSWFGEVLATRTLGAVGSLTVGARYEAISDIVDYVPVGPSLAAVGNLPSAHRASVIGRGTFNLDRFGFAGARLTADVELGDSSVRDPLLGEQRPISNDLITRMTIDLRHDVPATPLAWGTSLTIDDRAAMYRPDQIFLSRLTRPVWSSFIEHKDVLGLTVRATVRNLLGAREAISRDVFAPRRDVALDFTERQERRISPFLLLSVSGSF